MNLMMLKPLAVAVLTVSFLTACSTTPPKNNNNTIVFTEPELTAPFYALNPFNYDAPPPFEINLKKAASQPVTKMEVTRSDDPSKKMVLDTNKLIIPTVNSKERQLK